MKSPLKPKNAYNKPYFETAHLAEIVMNLLKQKEVQNAAIYLGYF